MPFVVGENVGPYRITARLGQGGMATVYRAYHANLDRYVAIKVLHAALKEDSQFLVRFQREAQIVAKLEHPNIVPTYDYNEHNGEPYLVMKFIEGETLKARLERLPLTLDETLRILTAVGQALTYAHEQDVLHRDIKPSNILLEKGVTPYLADFGLARMATAGESTLSQDMMLGTPQYISPEQAQGIKDLDASTDIYSLGVVLYEVVVGRVPFNADTPYAIVHDHIFSPLPLPSKVNPQVPQSVEKVLLKALAKNRQDRYPSAVQMVEAFRASVQTANLKELSPRSYRVPLPSNPSTTPGSTIIDPPASVPAGASTPVPMPTPPGLPPMPGVASLTGSTASQRYEVQQKRANLWKLGGFASLIMTCLAGMFVMVATFTDPNIQGGFAGAPPTIRGANQAATVARTALTTTLLSALASATASPAPTNTVSIPTVTATPQSAAGTTTAAGSASAVTFTPTVTLEPVGNADEAETYTLRHPFDGAGYFRLYLALLRNDQLLKAQTAFQTGVRFVKDNPTACMEIAQQFAVRASMDNKGAAVFGWPAAMLYGYAYANGFDVPSIRNEAGQYLFQFASTIRKADLRNLKDLVDANKDSKGAAGLYAFDAVAYASQNMDDAAKAAEQQAQTLNNKLAEVLLVQGILYTQGNSSKEAEQAYSSVIADGDAPQWAVNQAKTFLSKQ